MTTNELLLELDQLSQDFMSLAIDLQGAQSGLAAECSQRLRDVHDEFTTRFRASSVSSSEVTGE